jgi:hypothetical protein
MVFNTKQDKIKNTTIKKPNIDARRALRVVNFSRELGFYKIILEGDALQIMQALKNESSNWYIYDHLIEETRGVLQNMQKWKVHHVKRNLNGAAHQLAKVALSMRDAHVCLEETPHCIYDIIVVERCT